MSRQSVQFRLSSIPLVILAASTWLTALRFELMLPELEDEVARMEQLQSKELEVVDSALLSAVERYPTWYDEHIWDVFLPADYNYTLNLATHEIDANRLAPVAHSHSLTPGRHTIEMLTAKQLEGRWVVEVLVDGDLVIKVNEPMEWNSGRGSSGAGIDVEPTSPEGDFVLFRRRWMKPDGPKSYTTPNVPSEGLLLWVRGVRQRKDL